MVWKILGMAASLFALGCIVIVALVIYSFRPIIPIGKGISDLTTWDQIYYLAVRDQLETNPMLELMRRNGGEVAVSSDYAQCSPIASRELADKLNVIVVGSLKVRAGCDIAAPGFVFVGGTDSDVNAGYACGENCREDSMYAPHMIWGTLVLTH
jgi:hypothetical protein